jgi:hypothetical protein
MTKADKIRATAKKHPDWSTTRLGHFCDCKPEYVRVVLRQRVDGGVSEIDRRYRGSDLGKATLKKRRPRHYAYQTALYRSGDRAAARKASKAAYAAARKRGLSRLDAEKASWRVWRDTMNKTGDLSVARQAYASARDAEARA